MCLTLACARGSRYLDLQITENEWACKDASSVPTQPLCVSTPNIELQFLEFTKPDEHFGIISGLIEIFSLIEIFLPKHCYPSNKVPITKAILQGFCWPRTYQRPKKWLLPLVCAGLVMVSPIISNSDGGKWAHKPLTTSPVKRLNLKLHKASELLPCGVISHLFCFVVQKVHFM